MDNTVQIKKVKTLIYDIEVSPALGWFYPPTWKTRILRMEQYQVLMSISWAWYGDVDKNGEPRVHNVKLNDFKLRYKANPMDDYEITKKLHELLSEADIVIGHNSRKFDDKMANMYFAKHKLGPASPFKTVDTYSGAHGSFRFSSNRLDDIAKELGFKGKTDVRVGDLWYECLMEQNKKSWKLMQLYNDQDIRATYSLYEIERPYIKNHPNMGVYLQEQGICPRCSKPGALQSRGEAPRVNGMVRQWWCNPKYGGCKGWSYERLVEDRVPIEDRPNLVSA